MINIIEYIIFIAFTIFVFIKTLGYAIYEIKQENNKTGGIFVICFTLISCILANFALIMG